MKKYLYNTLLLSLLTLASTGLRAQYDDLYYDPDTDDFEYYADVEEYTDYDDYAYDDNEYDSFDSYDYYYTSRIRRFRRTAPGFGFYSPVFTDYYYYDPFLFNAFPAVDVYANFGSPANFWRFNNWRRASRFYGFGWNAWDPFNRWNRWGNGGFGFGFGNSWNRAFYGNTFVTNNFFGGGLNSWCGPAIANTNVNPRLTTNNGSAPSTFYGSRRVGSTSRDAYISRRTAPNSSVVNRDGSSRTITSRRAAPNNTRVNGSRSSSSRSTYSPTSQRRVSPSSTRPNTRTVNPSSRGSRSGSSYNPSSRSRSNSTYRPRSTTPSRSYTPSRSSGRSYSAPRSSTPSRSYTPSRSSSRSYSSTRSSSSVRSSGSRSSSSRRGN